MQLPCMYHTMIMIMMLSFDIMCVWHIVTLIDITGVFLSLNDKNIPNHGYVVISDIGTSDDGALLCNTDRIPDKNIPHSGGQWYTPNGTFINPINLPTVPGFGRNRSPGVVRLIRRTDTSTPAEGIYRCTVQDNSREPQSVYVGLYNSGGGVCSVNIAWTCTIP